MSRELAVVRARKGARGRPLRDHLVEPEFHAGGYRQLGRALCGADPASGFYEPARTHPDDACPRCEAKVRPDDTIDRP